MVTDSIAIKMWLMCYMCWYVYIYGPPPVIYNFFNELYNISTEAVIKYNQLVYPSYWDDDPIEEKTVPQKEALINEKTALKKYEDKYVDAVRLLNKEWVFDDEQSAEISELKSKIFNVSVNNIKKAIVDTEQAIKKLKNDIDQGTNEIVYLESCNAEGDTLVDETTQNELRLEQLSELEDDLITLKGHVETDEGLKQLETEANNTAHNELINRFINTIANCHVIEKTPQGNVLMLYDRDRETFKYYADSSIPYRYLEVVARKYVKMFNCRPLYVDMEEELKLVDEKWTKEYELNKAKELKEAEEIKEIKETKEISKKKNVFAKFKSYNKDIGGKMSMAPPPKNSIPTRHSETKENEKILLKERANRYTYEGKMANFNFLKKIDRKIFNKKMAISFSEFKKLNKK